MEKVLDAALEEAHKLNVKAEARATRTEEELIRLKNLKPEIVGFESSLNIGVTVYYEGTFGFASSSIISQESARSLVREAYEIAKFKSSLNKVFFLPELVNTVDTKESYFEIDPFSVSAQEKISILAEANEEALKELKDLQAIAVSMIRSFRKEILYGNTEGASIKQTLTSCGAEVQVYAVKDGELQVRSYPARDSAFSQSGFEFIKSLNLTEGARIAAEEAIKLLQAPYCKPGTYEAVISSDQMALQIHESIGHPVELDRVLGYEISLAGASYLKPEDLNRRQIASEMVNVIADATLPGGNGSFFYDDEGTKAQKFFVIKNGILENFLSSRESAAAIGSESNGCARAQSASRMPIVRMTNLNLLPDENGPRSLEEMISDIKDGIYLKTTRSWSIDDLRLNFQFAVEYAQEIRNGRLGRVVKNASYTGITPTFWRNVVSIGGPETFQMWGFVNCGKGDPMQLMHVGHGSPIVRVRNLQVGAVK
jgi:TldD protein